MIFTKFMEHDNRYDGFRSFCSQINKENISHFRNNLFFRQMVENVTPHFGNEYYYLILKLYIDKCKKINWTYLEELMLIGKPTSTQPFMFQDNKYMFSPKIMCYLKFTFDILTHIKQHTSLTNLDIVEIGGGYGCSAILLYEFAYLFDIKINSYTIIDLPEVNNLQKHFIQTCSKSNSKEYSIICTDKCPSNNFNFVFSNYALGEFNTYWQNFYIENIIKKTNHAYFCWNFSPNNPTIHTYFNTVNTLIKEEETPQTNTPPIKSYIIRY